MDDIVLRIDGKEARGKKGDTVLDVCKKNGIDVPALCHFEGLPNAGSCRMCIVEIEGQRGVNTACTVPAAEGMVVRTDTELLHELRIETLQLLFAERNHFCPFCEMSGDCELQSLAYRFKMDRFVYPFMFPNLPTDASNKHFVLDHNRCILCTRCVRVCSAKAGIDALAATQRSSHTLIAADLAAPLGESSCVSCGACVQICPTGALYEKRAAYRGRRAECTLTKGVCPSCSVGCGIEAVARANNVLAVLGDYGSKVNEGLLCVKGRFQTADVRPGRFTTPLIKQDGEFKAATWEEAMNVVAERLRDIKATAGAAAILGVASPRATNENLFAMRKFFQQAVGSEQLYAVDCDVAEAQANAVSTLLGEKASGNVEATLDEVASSDCFLVVGIDPRRDHGVVDSIIRRTAKGRGAPIIVIDSAPNGLTDLANVTMSPKGGTLGVVINGLMAEISRMGLAERQSKEPGNLDEFTAGIERYSPSVVAQVSGVAAEDVSEAAWLYGQAKRPMIVYGKGASCVDDCRVPTSLATLALFTGNYSEGAIRLLALREQASSRGALDMGFEDAVRVPRSRGVFFLAADDVVDSVPVWMDGASFVVVQAAYPSPATERADVILPAPTWAECEGSFTSTEGRIQAFGNVVEPPEGIRPSWRVFSDLARALGSKALEYDGVKSVTADIARSVPGYDGQWVKRAGAASLKEAQLVCVDYLCAERI